MSRLSEKDDLDHRDRMIQQARHSRIRYGRVELGLPEPSDRTLKKGDIFVDLGSETYNSYKITDVCPDCFAYKDGRDEYELPYESSDGMFLRVNKKGIPRTIAVSDRSLDELLRS